MPETYVCSRVDTIAMAKRLALYFTKKKGSSNTPYLSVEADWVNHTFYKTQRQPFEEGLPPFNMSEHNSQERTFR